MRNPRAACGAGRRQQGSAVSVMSWTQTIESFPRSYALGRTGEFDQLLTKVGASRDGSAFTALFSHFGPRVHAQMVRSGLTPVAAEDVTQDVMVTIWRKAHLYDARKSAAATWIFQIAHNRGIDLRRRSREVPCAAEEFLALPDSSEANDDRVDAAQHEECVRAALDALPPAQFAIVRLAFFEGLTHSAIAQRLNLPLGTVKSRLRLAFARLRSLLTDAGVTAG
jgi:RNA polymerase sigma factor (sigma-70 family)